MNEKHIQTDCENESAAFYLIMTAQHFVSPSPRPYYSTGGAEQEITMRSVHKIEQSAFLLRAVSSPLPGKQIIP